MTKEQRQQLIDGMKRNASISELCLTTKLHTDVVSDWIEKNKHEPKQTIQNTFEANKEIRDSFLVDVTERHEGNKVILTYQSRINY